MERLPHSAPGFYCRSAREERYVEEEGPDFGWVRGLRMECRRSMNHLKKSAVRARSRPHREDSNFAISCPAM